MATNAIRLVTHCTHPWPMQAGNSAGRDGYTIPRAVASTRRFSPAVRSSVPACLSANRLQRVTRPAKAFQRRALDAVIARSLGPATRGGELQRGIAKPPWSITWSRIPAICHRVELAPGLISQINLALRKLPFGTSAIPSLDWQPATMNRGSALGPLFADDLGDEPHVGLAAAAGGVEVVGDEPQPLLLVGILVAVPFLQDRPARRSSRMT